MQASVTEWLDNTAERYPDKIAMVDEWGKITFAMFRLSLIHISEPTRSY